MQKLAEPITLMCTHNKRKYKLYVKDNLEIIVAFEAIWKTDIVKLKTMERHYKPASSLFLKTGHDNTILFKMSQPIETYQASFCVISCVGAFEKIFYNFCMPPNSFQ